MESGVDLRIIKTKNKLRHAIGRMMTEVSFDDITVNDLCDAADVRRATFYRHYTDKFHFFSSVVSEILGEIVEKIGRIEQSKNPIDYYCSYVHEVINYCKSHELIFKNIIESAAFSTVKDIILHGTLSSFKHDLSKNLGSGVDLPTRVDILSEFLNGGISHIIIMWLTTEGITEEHVLTSVRELLSRLIPLEEEDEVKDA